MHARRQKNLRPDAAPLDGFRPVPRFVKRCRPQMARRAGRHAKCKRDIFLIDIKWRIKDDFLNAHTTDMTCVGSALTQVFVK
jgi:hypothetical protein